MKTSLSVLNRYHKSLGNNYIAGTVNLSFRFFVDISHFDSPKRSTDMGFGIR